MNIVLEGPDGAGKTTLARKIMERFRSLRFAHEGLPPTKKPKELLRHYASKLVSGTVHDRLHLGERVYGPIFRGEDNLGPVGQLILDHLILRDGLIIIVLPPLDIVLRNWQSTHDQQMFKDESQQEYIWQAYHDVLTFNPHLYAVNPYNEHSMSLMMEHLEWLYNEPVIGKELGVGRHDAKLLIVGDRANDPEIDLPFFSTTGSSWFLWETIRRIGMRHEEYFMTNAYKLDGEIRDLKYLIKQLPKLHTIVALGANAERAVIKFRNDYRINIMAHPQYYHRFKHDKMITYAEELNAARCL